MKQINLILLSAFICWILPVSSFGQETTSAFEYFSVQNGMISNNVYTIKKDAQGYIWVGTSAGISRFDGKNFIHFNSQNTTDFFEDNHVREIIQNNNTLYLVSRTKGVIQLNTQSFTFDRIIHEGVSSLDFAGDTTLILFSSNKLLLKTPEHQTTRFFSTKSRGVATLYKNKIYICFLGSMPQLLNAKTLDTEKKMTSDQLIMEGRFIKSKYNGLVYHSGRKIFQLIEENWEPIEIINDVGKYITHYSEDDYGAALFIVNHRLPYHMNNNQIETIHLNQEGNTELRAIYSIGKRKSFIATNQGMIQLKIVPKISQQLFDNLVIDNEFIRVRRAILETDSNSLLLTGYPGITLYNDSLKSFPFSEPLSIYDALLIEDKLIFATDGTGLWQSDVSGENLMRIDIPEISDDCWLFCLYEMDSNQIIIGGQDILLVWNTSTNKTQPIIRDKTLTTYSIIKHPKKPYYLAGTDKGLIFFNQGIKEYKSVLIPWQLEVKDLLFDTLSNSLWLATMNGVFQLDSDNYKLKRHYIQPTELTHPIVTALIQDDQRRVWASTYSGITVYGEAIYLLNQRNGINNVEFNYKSARKLKNGNLVFGGLTNYEVFNPHLLKSEHFDNDFIISGYELLSDKNKSNFKVITSQKSIQLGFYPDKEDLKIYVNNFDYNFARMYKFFYKVGNGQWIEIERDRYILITSIALGNHDLFIKMLTPYGEEVCVKHLEIKGLTPFYKHPYFVSALLIALLSLLLLAYVLLKRSNKIEFQTKHRVAMDLHDETGTILTRLLFMTKRKTLKEDDLENISSGLNDALFSLRSFMDSLTNDQVSAMDLQDELTEFMSKTFASVQISYEAQFIGEDAAIISAELYRDIKLCVYELVTNCIKHSNARHFKLVFEVREKEIYVQGSDDGRLTNIEMLNSYRNGMPNLKKRVDRQNGRIVFKLNKPTGLIIQITMQR